MDWYYIVDNQQQGPVNDAEISRLVQSGVIKPFTLVWNPTIGNQWVPASSVRDFFPSGVPGQAAPGGRPLPFPPTAGRTHNRDLMAQARECLAGNWGLGVAAIVIIAAIKIGVQFASMIPIIGLIFVILGTVIGPSLTVGQCKFFLTLARKDPAEIPLLFDGFARFGRNFLAALLMGIFIFLWTLLLIIPGILAAFSYSMSFFVLAEDPTIGARDAIRKSKELMFGNRWKFFCLGWRFFGWALLCILTLGIGFLFLVPYGQTSVARFYDDLKAGPEAVAPSGIESVSPQPQPSV